MNASTQTSDPVSPRCLLDCTLPGMVPSMKLSPHYAVAPLNTLSLEPLPAGRFVDAFTARTLAWLLLLICPGSLFAQQKVEGEWFVIPGEITTEAYRAIRNNTERAIKRGVQKIVYEFQSRELSEFGPCNDLATFFLQEIKGTVQTIAVVDGPINGNAVLPVLSCNSVYMTPQASLGFNQRALEKSGIIDVTKVAGFMKVGENRGKPVAPPYQDAQTRIGRLSLRQGWPAVPLKQATV